MADILTREQLKEQEARRVKTLEKMKAEGAPAGSIRAQEKKIELTRKRLERLKG